MAGVKVSVPSGEVSLSAGVAKTVLSLKAAANHRALVKSIKVFFKGIVTTDTPVKIRLVRITTDSGTGSAITEVKVNEADNETIQSVGRHTFTVEPTIGDVLETWEIHPQTGLVVFYPPDDELVIIGGNEVALEMTAAQAQTVSANLTIEE